jgi:hypothetical protein
MYYFLPIEYNDGTILACYSIKILYLLHAPTKFVLFNWLIEPFIAF